MSERCSIDVAELQQVFRELVNNGILISYNTISPVPPGGFVVQNGDMLDQLAEMIVNQLSSHHHGMERRPTEAFLADWTGLVSSAFDEKYPGFEATETCLSCESVVRYTLADDAETLFPVLPAPRPRTETVP